MAAAACLYAVVRVYLAGHAGARRRAGTGKLMTSDAPPVHPDLAPLAFLLGRWEGAGIGGYPTIESFRFGQEVSFSHNGKPFLSYASRTWRLDEDGQIGRRWAPRAGTGDRGPTTRSR